MQRRDSNSRPLGCESLLPKPLDHCSRASSIFLSLLIYGDDQKYIWVRSRYTYQIWTTVKEGLNNCSINRSIFSCLGTTLCHVPTHEWQLNNRSVKVAARLVDHPHFKSGRYKSEGQYFFGHLFRFCSLSVTTFFEYPFSFFYLIFRLETVANWSVSKLVCSEK